MNDRIAVATRLLGRVKDAIACDAFCSSDDGLSHAVVLSADGTLTDLVYDSGGTRTTEIIGRIDGASDVTAFWSDIDDVRNVIAVTPQGEVRHFSRAASGTWSQVLRGDVPRAMRVAGYDHHHHGIVLTENGDVTDQPFHGVTPAKPQDSTSDDAEARRRAGRGTAEELAAEAPPEGTPEDPVSVGVFPDASDIAALWADGDNRFVIIADASGAILEIGYGAYQPASRRELARLSGVQRLSACYLGDPGMGRRVVALSESGDLHLLSFGTELPTLRGPAARLPSSSDVACFKTPEGAVRAVLLVGDDIVEIDLP